MSRTRRDFLRSALEATVVTSTLRVITPGRARAVEFSAATPRSVLQPGEHDRLQPDWYRKKVAQVQAEMARRKLDALVLLNATNIIYTVGYFHLSTERPLAALIPKSGDPALFIPDLESDQVKLWWVQDYESYFDYPGPENRIRWIFERVARRGLDHGRIGIEEPTPSRLQQMKKGAPHAKFVNAGDLIEQMRWVKDEDELRIMRRAMYFADFSVGAGREFIAKNGNVTEDQILKATADALADKMSARASRRRRRHHRSAFRRSSSLRQALGFSSRRSKQRQIKIWGRADFKFWLARRRLHSGMRARFFRRPAYRSCQAALRSHARRA